MQTKITKTIRVSIDVKQHLDEMKGSVSASEFIETMLSYFERNGVDPRTSINGKFKTLELQGIERIIKIIRAIEKDKIDKLLPAPEAHSDELLDRADKQVTQLKAEVERLKQAGAPDVEDRRKLRQVVRLLESKYSINSLVYWVTYVHNVVYSFYRSMIYCYINSTQRCAGSIVIDIIPTNGADKRKFFPFAPYFPVTNVIKRYFYPYFPAIIGIKGYSFPYFPYLSGIMKIKTALYSLFSRLDWHKTVVFPCLGEIYEGIRSLSWEIPVT